MFDNPDDLQDTFYSHFISVLNKHAPLTKRRVKTKQLPGWLSKEIRDAGRKRDHYLKKARN